MKSIKLLIMGAVVTSLLPMTIISAQDRKTDTTVSSSDKNSEKESDKSSQKKESEWAEIDELFSGSGKYKGRHLFSSMKITGGGGGPIFFYGYGPSLGDIGGAGGRGFVIIDDTLRFGGMGFGFSRDFGSEDKSGAGAGGIFTSYLFRLDPLILSLGGALGGAGSGKHDPGSKTGIKDGYGYFFAMPQAEVEVRLFEWASMSIYGGYGFFIGKKTAPDQNHLQLGLAFTFGKF